MLSLSSGMTPLMRASEFGNYLRLKMLLQYNPNVDMKNNKGFAALMLALRGDHTSCAELLLQHHADVNMKDGKGIS